MKHALHRSSFNTDEHHYCSTDNEILKEESSLVVLCIMLTTAKSSKAFECMSGALLCLTVYLYHPYIHLTSATSTDPHPGRLERGAL